MVKIHNVKNIKSYNSTKQESAIDYEKAKELAHQILLLLNGEPGKESMIALCFSISRVGVVSFRLDSNKEKKDFVKHISPVIEDFLLDDKTKRGPKNDKEQK